MPSKYDVLLNKLREKDSGGGGAAGPLSRISTTVIVPGDSLDEFGFALDKTKTYRLVVEKMKTVVAGASLNFEVSEDGGTTYLTNKIYSNAQRLTSAAAAPTYVNRIASAFAYACQLCGINTKITFELSWSTNGDGWEWKASYSTNKDNTQSAIGYSGGGIIDVGGDIDFINFYINVNNIANANIYWYEVDYGF